MMNESAARVVPEVLLEYGSIVRDSIQRYLPTTSDRPFLDPLVRDYPSRGGKMMRSCLCMATARLFGASVRSATASCVAIELLHNALLIHDDIEDESDERRGKPTLHRLHGVPLALNAGDSLGLLSLRPLSENIELLGWWPAAQIFKETERMAWESVTGQALELGWRQSDRCEISANEYLDMVLRKTCWLATIYPIRVGAIIGRRESLSPEAFVSFGFLLGAAFQIQDDVLNLIESNAYGKERNGDLWEGKRTLLLGRVWSCASESERARMQKILALPRQEKSLQQVTWLRSLIEKYDAIEYAVGIARGLAGAALHEFDDAFGPMPESKDKQFVRDLAGWVLERAA